MINLAGRRYPLVSCAWPVWQPWSRRHSLRSSGPAARWIAPSTPPPPSSEQFAALTMASTARVVMSVLRIAIREVASLIGTYHASVDTGEQVFDADGNPDENHQPKAINSLIRQILNSFSKSAYVGYTATPFANIFIHRAGETKLEGPDLFPRAFIKNISAPSNYVGPARVFGLRGSEGRNGGLP